MTLSATADKAPGPLPGRDRRRHANGRTGGVALAAGLVGPNAAIQLRGALVDCLGETTAGAVFQAAGEGAWMSRLPDRMIPQERAAALFAALFLLLPAERAAAIAREAGKRVADYVIANRIPAPARALLKVLPAPLAGPLLCRAVVRNAWTFAGDGEVRARAPWLGPIVVEIVGNPLTMPGCAWHLGVFERLFAVLVDRRCRAWHAVDASSGVDRILIERDRRPV